MGYYTVNTYIFVIFTINSKCYGNSIKVTISCYTNKLQARTRLFQVYSVTFRISQGCVTINKACLILSCNFPIYFQCKWRNKNVDSHRGTRRWEIIIIYYIYYHIYYKNLSFFNSTYFPLTFLTKQANTNITPTRPTRQINHNLFLSLVIRGRWVVARQSKSIKRTPQLLFYETTQYRPVKETCTFSILLRPKLHSESEPCIRTTANNRASKISPPPPSLIPLKAITRPTFIKLCKLLWSAFFEKRHKKGRWTTSFLCDFAARKDVTKVRR